MTSRSRESACTAVELPETSAQKAARHSLSSYSTFSKEPLFAKEGCPTKAALRYCGRGLASDRRSRIRHVRHRFVNLASISRALPHPLASPTEDRTCRAPRPTLDLAWYGLPFMSIRATPTENGALICVGLRQTYSPSVCRKLPTFSNRSLSLTAGYKLAISSAQVRLLRYAGRKPKIGIKPSLRRQFCGTWNIPPDSASNSLMIGTPSMYFSTIFSTFGYSSRW